MKETLTKLDALIKQTRLDYYEKLNSGLSETEIAALEAKFNIALPPDLKESYKWKNGQNPHCYKSFVNNSEFVPLAEVLETRAEFNSMIGRGFTIENWWNAHWLPVFHNGGGSRICYDMNGAFTDVRGQIIEFWKANRDRSVIAESLESFLRRLINIYEDSETDETFTIEPGRGYPKIFYAG